MFLPIDNVGGNIVFQSQLFDQRLAVFTVDPGCFRAFITTDMDVFAGEEIHNFIHYSFKELESGV